MKRNLDFNFAFISLKLRSGYGILSSEKFKNASLIYRPRLIKDAIKQKLMIDPLYFRKPLKYSLKGYRCLSVDDYRIIFKIDN